MSTISVDPIAEVPRQGSFSQPWSLTHALYWCLVVAIVFLHAADFRGDTGESFAVHWQIYLRLASCALCGLSAVLMIGDGARALLTFPGLLMSTLVLWIGVTTPLSIDVPYSVAAYVCLGAVVLLVPAAMQVLGGARFLSAVATGLLLFIVGSWVAYLWFPDVGVFKERISNQDVVARMGGLGHPNELGYYCAYAIVLFAGLRQHRRIGLLFCLGAIALATVTLLVCYSRTSLVISCIGLLVVFRGSWTSLNLRLLGMLMAAGTLLVAILAFGLGNVDWYLDDALLGVSKSGSTEELATATGRTEIWAYGIQRILDEPLKGFGYGTARFVMVDHSFHCHNIVLNMCMYCGLIGGLLLIGMILYFLYVIWHDPRSEIDGLIAIILVGGLIEGILISPVPQASMLIWVAGLLWRQLGMCIDQEDFAG